VNKINSVKRVEVVGNIRRRSDTMTEYKSFYKTVSGGEGDRCKYPTRLDMYGCGCQHDCRYCYAKSLLEFRGLWNPQLPSMADHEKVARKLDKIESGTILRLGGMTDPFQPCESEYNHTKWLIEELNQRNIGYLIVTKSATVTDALSVMDKDLAHIQVSYTYTEGLAPEGYEKASEPKDRLNAASKAYQMGFDTQIRLSPYVPKFVDLNKVLECPVEKVVVEFLRINPMIARTLPEGNWNDWCEKSGGYRHLPLILKCLMLEPLDGKKRITVCEDHPEHYKYFKEHYNPNPDDCCDLRK